MPVWFEGIISEHNAVRNGVGIFDTSHMGRTIAKGPEVEKYVNWVVTNDVSRLEPMQGLYTVMLKPDAGIMKLDNCRSSNVHSIHSLMRKCTMTGFADYLDLNRSILFHL